MNKITLILIIMLLVIALSAMAFSATKTASVTGAWSATATWGGSAVPTVTDVVIINNGITVTITAAATCAQITINGTLTTTTFGLTIAGPWVNNGTINAGTGTVTFSGTIAAINAGTGTGNFHAISLPTGTNTLTINTSVVCTIFTMPQNTGGGTNTVNIAGTNTLTVLGLVTINRIAAFNVNAGTLIADSIDMTGGTATHVASLNITTGTITVLGNIAFSGDINTIQEITMGPGTLNIGGNLGAGGTFAAGTGTVNFDGTSVQTVGVYTYNNLTINNSAGATVSAPGITVNGILNLISGILNNSNPVTLGPSGSVQNHGGSLSVPLPVEMISFTAAAQITSALLKWSTATEINNYGFNIERRAIASSAWAMIGFVAGNGTSNTTHKYAYTDNNLPAGSYTYRIKQIDNDGTFKYSQSVELEVNLAPATIGLSQNYPNPFNPSTKISFALANTEYARLMVYNLLGQRVETLFDGIADGQKEYIVTFDASQLAGGIYFYKIQTATRTDVRRMMLVK